MTASLGSVTVPLIAPVAFCAVARETISRVNMTAGISILGLLIRFSSIGCLGWLVFWPGIFIILTDRSASIFWILGAIHRKAQSKQRRRRGKKIEFVPLLFLSASPLFALCLAVNGY